jgi:putative pyruvate formate lyase activating enzyme
MMLLGRPDARGILDDPGVIKSLPRYIDVVKKKRYAKFLIAKAFPIEYKRNTNSDELWKIHDHMLEKFQEHQDTQDKSRRRPKPNNLSFLSLKAALAHKVVQSCGFCERKCNVNRLKGEKGYCGAGRNFSLFSAFPHMGEEPELVPSGTIFTGGCTIRCIHCQNWDISQWRSSGISVTPETMALQAKELAERGCRNINMVGGDPTPVTWQWLETMNLMDINIATVWNSNSYYSVETSKLLAGFIDLYLLDFKYGNNKCAEEISCAPGYWEIATRNHLAANKYGELLIRLLVLPGHNECCTRPILKWIHDKLGPSTRVNLMFQYRPEWRAQEREDLRRGLTADEISEAKIIASDIGLNNLV